MLNTFIYTTQDTKNPELFEAITKGYFICYPTKLEDLLKDLIAINEITKKKINK